MKLFRLCLCSILFFFPGSSFAAGAVAVLDSIQFVGEKEGENGESIIFRLDREVDPRVFALDGGNPRMVLDFMETSYSPRKEKSITAGGVLVKGIRVGLHREPVVKTRVVIDLTDHMEVVVEKEYQPLQKILVVRVISRPDSEKMVPAGESDGAKEPLQLPREEEKILAPVPADASGTIVEEQASTATAEAGSAVPEILEPSLEPAGGDAPLLEAVAPSATGDDDTPEPVAAVGGADDAVSDPLSIALPPPAVSGKDLQTLVKVQFERTTNNKEMVLFHLNGFFPPVVFAIEEETPKIVCDFLEARLGSDIRPIIESEGAFINKVRVAEHERPAKVRVVLDLVAGRNYDLKQVFFKEDNIFVIILGDM